MLKASEALKKFELIYCHPKELGKPPEKALTDLSDRFRVLYGQAQEAELSGNYDIASCGYRNAIEALVKDYIHVYHDVPLDITLTKMPLQKCIEGYLEGVDTAVAAYVVKELGNNSTHYPIDPEHTFDFAEQKVYLDLFLYHIAGKVKIREIHASLDATRAQKLGAAKAVPRQEVEQTLDTP